jgi:hypothetical protein
VSPREHGEDAPPWEEPPRLVLRIGGGGTMAGGNNHGGRPTGARVAVGASSRFGRSSVSGGRVGKLYSTARSRSKNRGPSRQ